ncbi:PepSY-associated TM helix domain-containing protein [Gallaecimonas xiamenensis]|uniref:PepSY-associated TM helix domain-containing protein n=1 Tax=Gallaecimonas xiamenensis 3-C-1 TaxID=745411 RepID=K2JPF4_9GAMM|nr:PepSY-associated TM helix domain-containing protein [Gallaecimonas xiamenensis]EKE77103.1 hypothetical protein B3C1_02820 [Gallaecimonas xiamenensis 3-C-1]
MRISKSQQWLLKNVRLVHIYSSMAVLMALLFFAFTGVTLNHGDWKSAAGQHYRELDEELPGGLFPEQLPSDESRRQQLVSRLKVWLEQTQGLPSGQLKVRFDDKAARLELDVQRPGGYALAEVDLAEQRFYLVDDFAGYLSLANDLHKGRHAGTSWRWLIDAVAVICILFSLTGFYLLWRQLSRRTAGLLTTLIGALLTLLAFAFSAHT